MSQKYRVLLTGSSGAIGGPVGRELRRRGHWVRGLDLCDGSEPLDDFVAADLADTQAVGKAMDGIDSVIHLGAFPDDADFFTLLGPNVVGLYNVMNAARAVRARRVVLASSIQVVFGRWCRGAEPYSGDDHCPSNHYALTKLWAEQMGEMYAHAFGMSVIAARICWMVRNEREAARLIRARAFRRYLSRADAARFFACAVEAEEVKFAVLYAVGPEGDTSVDLASARRLIGYAPEDAWPNGLPFEPPPG